MDIISDLGEMKAAAADIMVINKLAGAERTTLCARVTYANTAGISRTAGSTSIVSWDSLVFDNANMWRPATSVTNLYVPQTGWYLVNAYITSITATAHQATVQLWGTRSGVNSYFGYNKREFAAGSSTYPNMVSATAIVYATKGDLFNVHWGSSAAITSWYGVSWVAFGAWKVG